MAGLDTVLGGAEKKASKCAVNDGILSPCPGLKTAIAGDHGSGRLGVTWLEVMNLDTGKTSRTAAVLRSGDIGKTGVILNYCPFCGAPIGEHFHVAYAKGVPVPT